jgi:hypothetical protein
VEDGAADDEVEGVVGVGDGLDGFDAEVFGGKVRGEGGGESAGLRDGFGTLIGGEDLVAFAEEIDEIAAGAAAGVEDSHAGHDVAAKELVEEVDVDRAELLLEGGHGLKRMIQDGQNKSGRAFCRCRCSGTGDDCGRVRDKNKSKGQSQSKSRSLHCVAR